MITLEEGMRVRCQSRASCSLGTPGCQNRMRVSGRGCHRRGCAVTCETSQVSAKASEAHSPVQAALAVAFVTAKTQRLTPGTHKELPCNCRGSPRSLSMVILAARMVIIEQKTHPHTLQPDLAAYKWFH